MSLNPYYEYRINKRLRQDQIEEAEMWRLFRKSSGWNPSRFNKVVFIIQSRWHDFWPQALNKKGYFPILKKPKEEPSI